MTHVSHLLRTDIRHFKWLLAGWVLVQAMVAVHAGTAPFAADGPLAAPVAVLGFVLTLASWLGLAFLVPLLLQTDPAGGSDAFWLTRPIPWRTLLLSKIVLIGGMCVAVPIVFEAILMAVFRVPVVDILAVAIQGILLQGLVVALLMAFAASTRTLAGFALAAGGLLLAVGLLLNVALIFAMRMIYEGPQIQEVTPRVESNASGPVLLLTGLIAALAMVVAVQYRQRSTRAAISAGALIAALAVALQFVWPWSYHVLAAPAWADRESALRLLVQAPGIPFASEDPWMPSMRPVEWLHGGVRLRLSGVERSWLGMLRLMDSSLQFDDGSNLATGGNGNGMTVQFEGVDDLADNAVLRDVLGVSRLAGTRWQGDQVPDSVNAIVLREADIRKRLGSTALYRGRFMLELDQLQIKGVVPLLPGTDFRDRGYRLVVEGVHSYGATAQLDLRYVGVTTFFGPDGGRWQQFYLRNPRTSEAIEGHEKSVAVPGMLRFIGLSAGGSEGVGFNLRRQSIQFFEQTPGKPAKFEITSEWLAQAELVVVRRVSSGSVVRTIEIPRAELVEAPRPTTTR